MKQTVNAVLVSALASLSSPTGEVTATVTARENERAASAMTPSSVVMIRTITHGGVSGDQRQHQ